MLKRSLERLWLAVKVTIEGRQWDVKKDVAKVKGKGRQELSVDCSPGRRAGAIVGPWIGSQLGVAWGVAVLVYVGVQLSACAKSDDWRR